MSAIYDLERFEMKRIGTVCIKDGEFVISPSDHTIENIERCVYAFVVGDEILRVGSNKGKLGIRFRAWRSDVSNALAGNYQRTPKGEMEIWRSKLAEHGIGYVYGRIGTVVRTPVGEFNLYQLEARALITRLKPRCCNNVTPKRTA